MHLILTHEQADFDALASLVAAKLLNPGALAVLPRRVNRNVRGFLTLYRDRLPYIEFGDLPKGAIRRVTLVDSQALPSLKGVDPDLQVHVIDHHPPGPEFESSWSTHFEEVGATTTLLVEPLRDAGLELDLVHATLL
ncbi:MAG: polynucleotide adenylyltransferase, partial [Anaerolineae bacterium]|nr:polynucleotide adenylyltransferase [Anaerolineae bacterium]NIN98564.1 polynucleotide adenylyltransferase [Anaerolineae bacterium]